MKRNRIGATAEPLQHENQSHTLSVPYDLNEIRDTALGNRRDLRDEYFVIWWQY
jgi:hypothetical protein